MIGVMRGDTRSLDYGSNRVPGIKASFQSQDATFSLRSFQNAIRLQPRTQIIGLQPPNTRNIIVFGP